MVLETDFAVEVPEVECGPQVCIALNHKFRRDACLLKSADGDFGFDSPGNLFRNKICRGQLIIKDIAATTDQRISRCSPGGAEFKGPCPFGIGCAQVSATDRQRRVGGESKSLQICISRCRCVHVGGDGGRQIVDRTSRQFDQVSDFKGWRAGGGFACGVGHARSCNFILTGKCIIAL